MAVWCILLSCYLAVIVIFMAIPASLGISFGIRNLYLATLYKVFEFGRKTIQSKQGIRSSVIDKKTVQPSHAHLPRNRSFGTFQREFRLDDIVEFCVNGVEAIIDDDVTKRFSAQELESWNLLTRTNENYHYISVKLTIMWLLGCFVRYIILFPMRFIVLLIGLGSLVTSRIIIAQLPKSNFRHWLDDKTMLVSFRIIARAVSAVITFHNKENIANGGGICVANHTTPIDVLILMCDRCYSLVGQRQPGFFGFIERTLAKTQDHIWFERTEMKDRLIVTRRLREHVEDPSKNPILIFPEGTCINNTSVMMFKKGSFEIGGDVYPVAIKYDPTFGNAFWNSSVEGFGMYVFLLLTNWALVCDVWYLPKTTLRDDETAAQFANRVKTEIARQGGLVDLIWDGQLKRTSVKPEFRQRRQEDYASTLKID